MPESPNFLTCPGAKELPPPKEHPTLPEPPKRGILRTPKEDRAPKKKQWWLRVLIGAIVGFLLIQMVPAVYALSRAGIAAQRAKVALRAVEEHVRDLEFEAARGDLDNAIDDLREARTHLRTVGVWRDLPWSGRQVRGLEDAVSAGIETLGSVDELLEIGRFVTEVVLSGEEVASGINVDIDPTRRFADLTPQEKREMLRRFQSELPRLRLARDKMDIANQLWMRIPESDLAAPIRQALAPLAETIPTLAKTLDNAVPLIEVVVPLAGYPDPRQFIVLLQNADEIRPSGGFIGNVGTVTVDGGELKSFEFQDVYAIDNPVSDLWKVEPPAPLKRWLGSSSWFLRDSNWSPDFPTSAERALDFYIREVELGQGAPLEQKPDSVVALEPDFFAALLGFTGPITVDGITFDRDNFFDTLQYEVEVRFHQQGLSVEERKEIVGRIGDELTRKIFNIPLSEWPNLLALVRDSLENKDIMIYSRDPQLLSVLDARGWTARVNPTEGDYLWVVDGNLAALKTDGAMRKQIKYELDADHPDGPLATVTLVYTNTAPDFRDFRYTRYRSYTRVYVPEGSQLLRSQGAMKDDLNKTGGVLIPGEVDVFHELGKTVFGAFWSVQPNQTGTLTFTYRLPESVRDDIRNGTYRLDVQKQPGVSDSTIDLNLDFGKLLQNATPAEDQSEWGDARYRVQDDTLRDRSFSVEL